MKKDQALLLCFLPLALLACVTTLPTANSFPPQQFQLSPLLSPVRETTATPSEDVEATEGEETEIERLEQATMVALNKERQVHDLPTLRADAVLGAIARTHAEDMVARDYFAHTSPEGVTYSDRLVQAGLAPLWYGENLIYGLRSLWRPAQAAVEWFMDSESHRKNILHESYTRVGVGVARLENGSLAFVLDFAAEEIE
jgi:uncharacterized protein YkwD